jgi:type I restriction enzyme, S subunit
LNTAGWELRQLGKCAKFLSGGTPSKARAEFWEGDLPWVSSGEMAELRIHDTPLHISEEGARAGSRLVPEDTVLAVVRGMSLAKEFRVSITKREVTFNQDLKAFACEPDIDSEFLFYALLARREHIRDLASEASHGTKRLETDVLASFEILVPKTRDVQRRVVAVLAAYDDLIENNRRRMALLEEAARQLYREWFVRLRFPGHEHTSVVDGVPTGWQRLTLGEACASLEDGDWVETKDQGGEDYRLLQISNIGVNSFVETGNYRFVTEETFRRLGCREVTPGQILIARMPTPIGRAWLVTEMAWKMVTAVDVAILTPRSEADGFFLVYHLNSPVNLERCERRSVGATRPRIARRELAELPVLLPAQELQRLFREVVAPLTLMRSNLYRQNDRLRAARDLLLPRLMSGEIAV